MKMAAVTEHNKLRGAQIHLKVMVRRRRRRRRRSNKRYNEFDETTYRR